MEAELTAEQVVRSIGWLDVFGGNVVDFDEVDWSGGDFVVLHGKHCETGAIVEATFHLTDFAAFGGADQMAMDDDAESFS